DPSNLATLVGRLANFLRDRMNVNVSASAHDHPGLERVSHIFGHHLSILMNLAEIDDEIAPSERDAVFRHCVHQAERADLPMSADECDALREYLMHFQATPGGLVHAIECLRNDTRDDVAALAETAHALVEADGEVRFREALWFSSFRRELAAT